MTTVPSEKMGQIELIPSATDLVSKHKNARKAKEVVTEHLPANLAQPVKAKVPDFSDPNRPNTCLEVDFPSCRSTPSPRWRATPASPSTR